MKHLCWTRAGDAGGERLYEIIERKERERNALNGVFFWQVGNRPPVKEIKALHREKAPVRVIFSKIKGPPKKEDRYPERVLVWQDYYNCCRGITKSLPDGALVTSGRASCDAYALVCRSKTPLEWRRNITFEPDFLNKKIARQQTTALLERGKYNPEIEGSWMLEECYRKKMMVARLAQDYGYWVCLQNPREIDREEWEEIRMECREVLKKQQSKLWLDFVRHIRSTQTS